mgnify:CR=1 FL=1
MSLNSLLDKAISVANVAGKKTEEMVEASKLKLQEVSVNADLQDCYEKIGSLVYRSKKSGEDNAQAIDQLVEQADVLLEQLAQLQSKREEIKKMKKCPNCGAFVMLMGLVIVPVVSAFTKKQDARTLDEFSPATSTKY